MAFGPAHIGQTYFILASKEKTVLAIPSALISTILLADALQDQVIWYAILAVVVVLGLVGLVLAFFFLSYGKLWFQALMSQADVSFRSLVGMGFHKVRPDVIAVSYTHLTLPTKA